MSILESLTIDKDRTPENINKIYLMKEGESPWYRAFGWSAYLMKFFPNGLEEKDKIKATRKRLKDGLTFTNVGLQITSVGKYLPNVYPSAKENNILEISVNLDLYENNSINFENYLTILETWENTLPIKENKSNGDGELISSNDKKSGIAKNSIYNNPISFSYIMKEILRYSTDNKTEEDLLIFIKTLKEYCASLI